MTAPTCASCRHYLADYDSLDSGLCTHPLNLEISDADMHKRAGLRLAPQTYSHETCERHEPMGER